MAGRFENLEDRVAKLEKLLAEPKTAPTPAPKGTK